MQKKNNGREPTFLIFNAAWTVGRFAICIARRWFLIEAWCCCCMRCRMVGAGCCCCCVVCCDRSLASDENLRRRTDRMDTWWRYTTRLPEAVEAREATRTTTVGASHAAFFSFETTNRSYASATSNVCSFLCFYFLIKSIHLNRSCAECDGHWSANESDQLERRRQEVVVGIQLQDLSLVHALTHLTWVMLLAPLSQNIEGWTSYVWGA